MKLLQIGGVVLFLIGMTSSVNAQQEPQFLQNLDNMLYYNPAYAGSRGMLNMSALHRQQWMGFKGAPMTTTFQMHTPLKYESAGVGFSFINDKQDQSIPTGSMRIFPTHFGLRTRENWLSD